MEVRVLGVIEVVADDGRVTVVSSPNQRLVLAVLAAHAGEVVRADRLVEALWGEEPPPSASTSLRAYVSRLRRLLGDQLVIHPTGYELRAGVDAVRLDRLVTAAADLGDRDSLAMLDDALDRWQGEPYPGLDHVRSLDGPRLRLVDLALVARARRARALLETGRADEAVLDAEAVVAADPWREGTWEVLVDALAADHRPADALRAYQRAVGVLAEAGLEPGAGLRRAEAAVLAGPDAVPALTATNPPVGRTLPAPTTSLLGRDDDLAAVARLLDEGRLVTLLGPGGVGKTRLGLEAARSLAGRHEWGARLISLESVDDAGDVPAAVIDGLGLASDGRPLPDRLSVAGGLDLLVVLDNCEHVLEAAAAIVASLCAGGERMRIVATSRERLGIAGERVWPVHPLPTSTAGRALLVDRARATRPDLDLTDVDLIDQIVEQLDGLPLAIEMAASQLATASLADLARDLEDDLAVLTGRDPIAPPRHRSLGELVRWTTERIDATDRAVLAELSVFAGPIDAAAAAAVTGRPDAGPALRRLAERSLLAVHADGTTTAFTMIGPIRACAAGLLASTGRADEIAAAHAGHLVRLARAADAELRTEHEERAVRQLDRALPDLRAAHRWSTAHDPATAVALSAALFVYAQTQVRLEVLGWASELAAAIEGRPTNADADALAVVLGSAAHAAVLTGDLATGRALAERGLTVEGADLGRWAPLEIAADIALFEGRLDEAVRLLEVADRDPDDPHLRLLLALGRLLPAAYRGDLPATNDLLVELVGLEVRSPSDRAWVAYAEGEVVLDHDPPRALAALERSVALADQVGNRYVGGVARVSMCSLQARVGDPDVAATRFIDAIDHWREQGATTHLVTALRNLPVLLDRLDRPDAAAELIATLETIDVVPTWGAEADRLDAVRRHVQDNLDDDVLRRARSLGASRSLDDAARAASAALTDRLGPG